MFRWHVNGEEGDGGITTELHHKDLSWTFSLKPGDVCSKWENNGHFIWSRLSVKTYFNIRVDIAEAQQKHIVRK